MIKFVNMLNSITPSTLSTLTTTTSTLSTLTTTPSPLSTSTTTPSTITPSKLSTSITTSSTLSNSTTTPSFFSTATTTHSQFFFPKSTPLTLFTSITKQEARQEAQQRFQESSHQNHLLSEKQRNASLPGYDKLRVEDIGAYIKSSNADIDNDHLVKQIFRILETGLITCTNQLTEAKTAVFYIKHKIELNCKYFLRKRWRRRQKCPMLCSVSLSSARERDMISWPKKFSILTCRRTEHK